MMWNDDGQTDVRPGVKVVARENERLKVELETVKQQLEHETSLLEEEKNLMVDEEDIKAKLIICEQAKKNLLAENEVLVMELCKARRQLEDAAKTLKILTSTKMPYSLLNAMFFPPSRSYTAILEKTKSPFQTNWRSVAALAVAKNCSLADLIVFYQCGNIFGLTRDAKNVIWRARIDSTICHAVVDERRGVIYYSAHFLYPGVYSVSIKKLETGRTLNLSNPTYVKTETLLNHPRWVFRGLAIDRRQDWLYCCARVNGANNSNNGFELNYSVGVWDLRDLKCDTPPLFFIEYDPSTVYLCQPFQPYYCAVYQSPDKDAVLAISDWRNSNIHMFTVDSEGMSCKFLQTVASHGTAPGSVAKPCAVQFDRLGNLVVAESNNRRLQLFASCKKEDGRMVYEPKWLSETYNSSIWSLAISQYDDYDERNITADSYPDELTDILYVGMNDSGRVLCVNTPCFS